MVAGENFGADDRRVTFQVKVPMSDSYWFPAKRRGWGWGVPTAWQGKLVLVCWISVVIAALLLFGHDHVVAYMGFVFAMICLLLSICYLKGEPPAWR
jgi:hypothetical protein